MSENSYFPLLAVVPAGDSFAFINPITRQCIDLETAMSVFARFSKADLLQVVS